MSESAAVINQSEFEYRTHCQVAVGIGRSMLESESSSDRRDLLARAIVNLDLIDAETTDLGRGAVPYGPQPLEVQPKPFFETLVGELRESDIWAGESSETQKVIKMLQVFAADRELATATNDTRSAQEKGVEYYSGQLRRSVLLRGIAARRRTTVATRTRISYPVHV